MDQDSLLIFSLVFRLFVSSKLKHSKQACILPTLITHNIGLPLRRAIFITAKTIFARTFDVIPVIGAFASSTHRALTFFIPPSHSYRLSVQWMSGVV